jgi:histidine triad (HIT) family protein
MPEARPMPNTCLFCKMIHGEVATPVVYESEVSFGFLDHRPLFLGQCLLVPRLHVETLADLPAELIDPVFADVQLLTRAVETAMAAQGSFVAMNNRVSQSVPHLHVHIVPRNQGDGLKGFFWPRTRYSDEAEMERVRKQVRRAIERVRRS